MIFESMELGLMEMISLWQCDLMKFDLSLEELPTLRMCYSFTVKL